MKFFKKLLFCACLTTQIGLNAMRDRIVGATYIAVDKAVLAVQNAFTPPSSLANPVRIIVTPSVEGEIDKQIENVVQQIKNTLIRHKAEQDVISYCKVSVASANFAPLASKYFKENNFKPKSIIFERLELGDDIKIVITCTLSRPPKKKKGEMNKLEKTIAKL